MVQTWASDVPASSEILYRIGEAEATLLNDEMRRDYDRRLNLFEKRRKNRQVDPFASPSRVKSRPGRTVGEDFILSLRSFVMGRKMGWQKDRCWEVRGGTLGPGRWRSRITSTGAVFLPGATCRVVADWPMGCPNRLQDAMLDGRSSGNGLYSTLAKCLDVCYGLAHQ